MGKPIFLGNAWAGQEFSAKIARVGWPLVRIRERT